MIMKKFVRFTCVILVFGLLLAVPANAESVAEPKGSAFFSSYGTDLYKTSSTSFEIWFDVTSNAAPMDLLGVSEIALYQSADGQSWSKIKIYTKSAYAFFVDDDATYHGGHVTYDFATPGYYYRARITFYAKKGNNVAETDIYTEILRM